jgi:hypothetical protein
MNNQSQTLCYAFYAVYALGVLLEPLQKVCRDADTHAKPRLPFTQALLQAGTVGFIFLMTKFAVTSLSAAEHATLAGITIYACAAQTKNELFI